MTKVCGYCGSPLTAREYTHHAVGNVLLFSCTNTACPMENIMLSQEQVESTTHKFNQISKTTETCCRLRPTRDADPCTVDRVENAKTDYGKLLFNQIARHSRGSIQFMHIRNKYFNIQDEEMYDDPFGGYTICYSLSPSDNEVKWSVYNFSHGAERFIKDVGRNQSEKFYISKEQSEVSFSSLMKYLSEDDQKSWKGIIDSGHPSPAQCMTDIYASFRQAFEKYLARKYGIKSRFSNVLPAVF